MKSIKWLQKSITALGGVSIDFAEVKRIDAEIDKLLESGHFMDKDKIIILIKKKDKEFKQLSEEKDLLKSIFNNLHRCANDEYSRQIFRKVIGGEEYVSEIEEYIKKIEELGKLLKSRTVHSKQIINAVKKADEKSAKSHHDFIKRDEEELMKYHTLAERVHGDLYRSLDGVEKIAEKLPKPKTSFQRKVAYGLAVITASSIIGSTVNKAYSGESVKQSYGQSQQYDGGDGIDYDKLAKQAKNLDPINNPNEVIKLLDQYKMDKTNQSTDFFNNLGVSYLMSGSVDEGLQLLKHSMELDNTNADAIWNYASFIYKFKKDGKTAKKYFKIHSELDGKHKEKADKYVKALTRKGF